jgi:SNF2 family DNA or RNA helicase
LPLEEEASKNKIINFFYSNAKEEDWLDGLDLYQLGRINKITEYEGLFSAEVSSFEGRGFEVRLRVRSTSVSGVLQWAECNCQKNRKSGLYCEHIIALMLQVNKNYPSLFENLASLSPAAENFKNTTKDAREKNQKSSINTKAAHSLLDRIKSKIKKISFKGNGQFEIEMSAPLGGASSHILDLDTLASYIENVSDDKKTTLQAKNMNLSQDSVWIGLHIYENKKNEELVLEKSFSFHDPEFYTEESPQDLFPIEEASCGNRFLYHSKMGFFPIKTECQQKSIINLKNKETLRGDEIPLFFEKDFESLTLKYPCWMEKQLKLAHKITTPTLSKLKFLKQENGWFYLDPIYKASGESIPMIKLIQAHGIEKKKYYKTKEGWIKIPEFIKDTKWNLQTEKESLTIATNALGILRLKALAGEFDHLVGSKKALLGENVFEETAQKEIFLDENDTTLELREYQKEGLKWLCWLYNNGLHGLLADDMGLGKTHQAMALLELLSQKLSLKKKNPHFLVICPTTVIDHWHNKIQNYAPQLQALKHHGNKRFFSSNESEPLTLITSYGILLRDHRKFGKTTWDAIILDEAHYIKNNKTMTYKAVCHLESNFRLCLTGTPMENHLGELKNLFDFLVPGYLGSNHFFNREFIQPITQLHDLEQENLLQKLIYPVKLRRTKQEVLSELPEKIEDIRYCTLSSEQASLYQQALSQHVRPLLEKIESQENISYLHIFKTLQLLKQICNHPALVLKKKNFEEHKSGKFELLKDLLLEALESGQKIVIFSQYLGMVNYIENYCKSKNVGYVSLTGSSSERGKIIEKFQEDPKIRVFIGSLLAGGMGIDLTAASVVIHYDRWWNPSKENQATDRVHRIGQKKSVQVFKLVTRGTLEEKIDELIQKKANEFNKFFEQDKTVFKSLSKEDIINLLSD